MEKKVIFINKLQVNNEIQICEDGLPVLQELLNEFEKNGCKLTAPKLFNFFEWAKSEGITPLRTEKLVKQTIVDNLPEIPQIMGLTISKEKFYDMVEIPNLHKFVELIETAQRQMSIIRELSTLENGTLELKKDFAELIKLRYTVFTENERQNTALHILTTLKDELNKYVDGLGIKADGIIEGLEIDNGKYRIDGRYIKRML